MKKLLFAGVIIATYNVHAACNKPVNQKKIVLFIDNNDGAREIETARAAACARGENFVVLPDRSKKDPNGGVPFATADGVRTLMTEWKASGAKPVSIMISGHDGGGGFSGTSGSISRGELSALMNYEFPELKSSVRSLYLLGCYTGVKYELFSWMNIFPELKMIAGYEGAAPLSDKKAGHSYIKGLMLQENTLMAQTSANRLQSMINNIPDIGVLNNGLMIQAQCIDPQTNKPIDFYHRSQPESGKKFETLNSDDCKEKIAALADKGAEFAQYFDGLKPVPEDTRAGALRVLYNFYRSAEHCFENITNVPKGDQVLGMLFYPGFSENIARYLENESMSLSNEINKMTLDDWGRALDSDKKEFADKAASYDALITRGEADPKTAWEAAKKKEMENYEKLTAIYSSDFGRQLTNYYHRYPDVNPQDLPSPPFDRNKVQELITLSQQVGETLASQVGDANSYMDQLKLYRDAYKSKASMLEQYPRTQENLDTWKKNFWVPNRENVVGKTRSEHLVGLHKLYTQSNEAIGVPGNLRKRFRALSDNMTKLMGNLKCLPLSWHEPVKGNLESPTCPMADPSRRSGEALGISSTLEMPDFNSPEDG